MEELNNRLTANCGNSVIVVQIISKLIQSIKNKRKKDNSEIIELTFLKEKCLDNNHTISAVAAEAILHIVHNKDFMITASDVMTDLITVITTTKCPCSNITYLINNLLIKTELSTNNDYKCSFNLQLPQHPLIVMLDEDPNAWSPLLKEIVYTYTNTVNSNVSFYNELYKPVFLYVLCNPHENNNSLLIKQKLWTFIMHNEIVYKHNNMLNCLLSWMQFERRDGVHINPECRNVIRMNSDLLSELSNLHPVTNSFNEDLLLLWETSALHQLILNNFDPRAMIFSIRKSICNLSNDTVLNSVLLILVKTVPICPSVYLLQLLNLYKQIITRSNCDAITAHIIKYSLLQWISSPSILTSDALIVANQILSFLKSTSKNGISVKGYIQFSKLFKKFINTNNDVYIAIELCILLETWKKCEDIINWLKILKNTPVFFVLKIIEFLLGLFLCEFKEIDVSFLTFELILKCVDYHKALASNVLTVILHKLTTTTNSHLHHYLLKTLSKMAVIKDNTQKIINTIQVLNKGGNSLKTFSTILMLDLWKMDNKCYPHLETLLITPYNSQCDKWEFYVTRAYVLKEICALRPELHGKDMVAHLSKILNECKNAEGALPSSLAIIGITLLCKYEIIDAVTTWATLAPMFKEENRISVIKSLCFLISEIPNLSYTEAYPKLTEEVVSKLWEFTVYNRDNEVWKAALDALTHFNIEQIVAQMPDEYCDDETINLKKNNNTIPGQCWIHFLKNCDSVRLAIVGDFLIKMTSLEISNYLKFVYQVKGTREPQDYSYLPVNSVVRGISTYIKSKVLKWKGNVYKEVYLQCLRIFTQEYSKPLPPLDWCFLQELVHESEAKDFCIDIASHQVILSGTARRFMVNYIEVVTENHTNEKDVLRIYRNLKYLANSVQPFTLMPFLEVTIYSAIESYKSDNKEPLLTILEHLKATLKDPTIQESNKTVIAEILKNIFDDTDMATELFNILLECIICLPVKNVNDLSSPKQVNEVRSHWLRRATKIRCHLALNSNQPSPLNWLNELMEIGYSFPGITEFVFQEFIPVFQKHKDNTESVLWILELIGQIQALTADKAEEKKIIFLCNVFILATLVFSGHYIFLNDFSDFQQMYNLFPRAIATLLEVNHWSICTNQVLEWFYHMNMNTDKIFHKEYKDMFVQCLQSLRNDDEFHKYMKWTKYLNVEFL